MSGIGRRLIWINATGLAPLHVCWALVSSHRKAEDMVKNHMSNRAGSPSALTGSEVRTVTSYERELVRLREALAREAALLHQRDELIRKLFALRETAVSRVAKLTPRQRQIMDLVLAGHPSKNIAADLGIAKRTVENHRASIMKKTGSTSIPALARVAFAAAWSRSISCNRSPTVNGTPYPAFRQRPTRAGYGRRRHVRPYWPALGG
jgi:DNA-binding CsgD family transcriptional regulator